MRCPAAFIAPIDGTVTRAGARVLDEVMETPIAGSDVAER